MGLSEDRGRQAAPDAVASVPSASFFKYAPVAPESMVSAFGSNLAAGLELAQAIPLPTTLGGVQVKVKDSAGVERPSSLIAVLPTQVNYILPRAPRPVRPLSQY